MSMNNSNKNMKKETTKKEKTLKKPKAEKSALSPREVSVGSATVYNQKGKEVGEVKLPENVFGLSWNADLVHQVITSTLSDSRTIYAHTKDRGELS